MLPIQWNLTMVLAKSQAVELLCPMFIQNLGSDSKDLDKSNEDLYKEIIGKQYYRSPITRKEHKNLFLKLYTTTL